MRACLEAAAKAGLSKTSVGHLKKDISSVLGALWSDQLLPENVAKRVSMKTIDAAIDTRPRVVLTDDEFARLVSWPEIAPELRTLCMVSRYLGGARTSDLHALDWSHIDLTSWVALVPRPKTAGKG